MYKRSLYSKGTFELSLNLQTVLIFQERLDQMLMYKRSLYSGNVWIRYQCNGPYIIGTFELDIIVIRPFFASRQKSLFIPECVRGAII